MRIARIAWVSVLAVVAAGIASPPGPWAQEGKPGPETSKEAAEQMAALSKAAAPGKHHEQLKKLVGRWEAKVRMYPGPGAPPIAGRGWMTNKMVLDDRFLQQDYVAEMGEQKFRGLGLLGYDNTAQKHFSLWMDTASTMVVHFEGTCSNDGKRIEMSAEHLDPLTGEPTVSRAVLEIRSLSTHTWEGYSTGPDGEYKSLEILFQKREE